MTTKTKIKKIEKVFDWCVKYYGKSKYYKTYPTLIVNYSKKNTYHGEFYIDETDCDDIEVNLIVYINMLRTTEELVKTVVHEYQHYLQHPSWLTRYYHTKKYCDNPYELLAELEAQTVLKKCIKECKI